MATTTATMSAAGHRTFGISELRDNILQHLPAQDLLLLQRVSKSWQRSILTTSSIDFRTKTLLDITIATDKAANRRYPRYNELIFPEPQGRGPLIAVVGLSGGAQVKVSLYPHRIEIEEDKYFNMVVFHLDKVSSRSVLSRDSRYEMYLVDSHGDYILEARDEHTGPTTKPRSVVVEIIRRAKFGTMLELAQKMYIWADGAQSEDSPMHWTGAGEIDFEDMCTKEELELFDRSPSVYPSRSGDSLADS